MSDDQNDQQNDAPFGTANTGANTGGGDGDSSGNENGGEAAHAPAPTPASDPGNEIEKFLSTQRIVYGLYALSFAVAFTSVAGLIVAYLVRADAAPWLQTHYTYLIRTFWISLVYMVIAITSIFIFVAPILIIAVAVWFLVRVVLGWIKMEKGEPIAKPESWWLGQ